MAKVNLEVQAQVNDAIREMGRLNKQFDLMGRANQDAAGALGVFEVSLTSLNSPLTAIASGLKASMDAAIGWSNTIDDVQKITGETAEETSKLVTVMEDFGVSSDSLKGAAKALKEQGLTPNLATLKDLAKQYQAIQDPAERTKWGTEKLGRAFFDLAEILGKTPEEFAAVEAAAKSSGKIIGQDMVDQMEAAQIKAKQLQDRVEGLKIAVGVTAVNTLSDAADGFDNLTLAVGASYIAFAKSIGVITDEEAVLRITALAAGDLSAAYVEQTSAAMSSADAHAAMLAIAEENKNTLPAVITNVDALSAASARWAGIAKEELAKAAEESAQKIRDLELATAGYSAISGQAVEGELKAYQDKQRDLGAQIADTKTQLDILGATPHLTTEQKAQMAELSTKLGEQKQQYADNAEAHNLATRKIILGYLEQQLAADGLSKAEIGYLLDIGEQWGVYGDDTKRIWDATVATIKDGALDADETMRTLGAQFPSYFTDINRNINYQVNVSGNVPYGAEPGGDAPVNYGAGGNESVPTSGGYASGGMAYGPMSGHWELLHGNERVLSPEQTKAYNSGQGGGVTIGNVSINVNGAGNPQAVAESVMIELSRLTRSAVNSGAAMIGVQ